ncbi:efflux transporter outer membrane subunit [Lichenicoccus roseus]|uniref:Efflux transporter outer membrane subunit n=1 Tax=Lichenicoccus roseus TaxID=2683649 RepID=A0A5R9JB11_9PROT|nr:efflux transporter outer membrane subunit [Lichenicoccus roseus]TLU74179.1 efflux transporter outer membrane subunit [Lichenicoccus roseus]
MRRGGLARAAGLAGLAVLTCCELAGCDLAPSYRPPHPLLPASYQGSAPFRVAHPLDRLPRGPWWQSFGDPVLDTLEARLELDNPNLLAAYEAYTQSRDLAGEARSGLFPQMNADAGTTDNKQSQHRLFRGSPTGTNEQSSNTIGATVAWDPDLWSRIRNETKLYKEQAQATAADVANARLSLEVQLASDYIALRGLDTQHYVYQQSIALYRKAVGITSMRLAGKIASGLDVARAQNQLAAAEAEDSATLASRATLQHAIAVLTGTNPSSFSIAPVAEAHLTVPVIPAGVPSTLLQRRPDIAAAERDMAAASAAIGVSRAAFYPDVTISLQSGFQDYGWSLASLTNSMWAVGASALLPLFEGGLRKAELQRSWSSYSQTADNYRATVLTAFQQVEDGLSLTGILATELSQQVAAVRSADKAQDMTLALYTGGLDNYLDVTVSQVYALTAQIAAVQVETTRLQAAVNLIGALGGGWSTGELPTPDQTLPFNPLSPARSPGDVHTPG